MSGPDPMLLARFIYKFLDDRGVLHDLISLAMIHNWVIDDSKVPLLKKLFEQADTEFQSDGPLIMKYDMAPDASHTKMHVQIWLNGIDSKTVVTVSAQPGRPQSFVIFKDPGEKYD